MVTVGVDLGGTNILVVVLDDDDERRGSARMKTPVAGERNEVLEVMEAAVHAALGDAGLDLSDVEAIGVGTPGVVIDGTVGGAANVPGWQERFSLKEGLEGRIDATVRVVNDVSAAAAAEHRMGAATGHDDVLVVFVGTGVGGGLILGGRPYEGAFGGAGEFGHTVVVMNGRTCPCGRRGCVEAYAGRRSMEMAVKRAVSSGTDTVVPALVEERDHQRVTSGVIRDALDLGDPLVADLVEEAVQALGAGIASAVNLIDPEIVILGGGLGVRFGERLGPDIRRHMEKNLFLHDDPPEFQVAALGDFGGALGAALLVA